MKRLIALLLCCVLLCGCGAKNALGFRGIVKFEDMEYVRPDMAELTEVLEAACATALEGKNLDTVIDGIYDFYDVYDAFYTAYDLAYVHYCIDMTDIYWQGEYDYLAQNAADVDAALTELYYALADSPLREELEGDAYFGPGYFDYYDGESMYDETFLALLEQEQALISEYYELNAGIQEEYYSEAYFDAWTGPLVENLLALIAVRQEQAAWAGYDSYQEFAYDFYYYRDYTWDQADEYLRRIRTQLVPLYRQVNESDIWDLNDTLCREKETFSFVKTAAKNMGGTMEEAFLLLEQAELYDIGYSPVKSDMSFEVFFTNYYEPFVFVCGTETPYDKLSFAHEFGHFATDYAAAGSYAGTDVLEVFSQATEYLALCYGEDTQELTRLKLADSLDTYVTQACYAAFEHGMYELTGEELTAENLLALYEEIGTSYGFDSLDWDPRDVITVPHFYAQPLYIISYVVSNDVAMQIYQLELEEPGAGLACLESNLATEEYWFLSFVGSAGLNTPFAAVRLNEVQQLLEETLG